MLSQELIPPPSPVVAGTGKSCCLTPLRPQSKYTESHAGFLSGYPNWVPPPPQEVLLLPPWDQGGRHTRLRGRGVGASNSDAGTDTPVLHTDKKEKFSSCLKKIQIGLGAKSYMRKGFLIFEKMHSYLTIYEEAVSHICVCIQSFLNFLIYGENLFSSYECMYIIIAL